MPIDPTTLHGRPWKSLTVEERKACPDGTELRHPTRNFGPLRRESGLWVDLAGNTHDTATMTLADPMGYVVHIPDASTSTTLHGRTLGSLTVEELEACPEGSELCLTKAYVKVGDRWDDGAFSLTASGLHREGLGAAVLHLPGKEPPAEVPDPKPPVYAIGRFVVVPLASGDRLAFAGASVAGVSTATNYIAVYLRDAHGSEVSYVLGDGVTMDALLHAIAKAEGR